MKEDVIHKLLYSTLLCYNNTTSNHLPTIVEMIDLITESTERVEQESITVSLKGEWTIVGDIHGDSFSLIRMFSTMGYPPERRYLFLGDYVDRGENSIEVLIILMCLKVLYKDSIYLLRGNHETRSMTISYGFENECLKKMNEKVYESFMTFFDQLPLVALINSRIFCVHGGISKKAIDFFDIFVLKKPSQIDGKKEKQIVHDLLWSDPCHFIDFFMKSDRGGKTFLFGEKALNNFLDENELSCVIRAHQICMKGYDKPFDNVKCWTVFSSANYCQMWNQAAALIINDDYVNEVVVFDPVNDGDKKLEKVILPDWILLNGVQVLSHLNIDNDLLIDDDTCDLLADNPL